MSDRRKFQRIGRDAIIYDPDGLSIEIGTEFLESPSGQDGICIYSGTAKYTSNGQPVEKEVMKRVQADLMTAYSNEGMFIEFD